MLVNEHESVFDMKTGVKLPQQFRKDVETMIMKKVNPDAYEALKRSLRETAHIEPMDAGYTVDMCISGVNYAVKLVLERHNQVAVIQASRIDRYRSGQGDRLIVNGALLNAFLEILTYQAVN